ncbi:MAG: RDD family protein [Bacteroidota bacterium]
MAENESLKNEAKGTLPLLADNLIHTPETIIFSAEETALYPYGSITLHWDAGNAVDVQINGYGPVQAKGSLTLPVKPFMKGMYSNITIRGRAGESGREIKTVLTFKNLIYSEISVKLKHKDTYEYRAGSPMPENNREYAFDPRVYAGFWRRGLAYCIDLVIWFLTGLTVAIVYTRAMRNYGSELVLIGFVLGIAFCVLYKILFEHLFGASIGKLVTGIRVADSDTLYPKLTFRQAFLRNFPIIIIFGLFGYIMNIIIQSEGQAARTPLMSTVSCLIELWFLVDIIFFAKNRDSRSLHDLLGKTAVINRYYAHNPAIDYLEEIR